MVSASWVRRKSSSRSACEPRAPRWTSEINKVRKRRSGHSSLIPSLPMRERLADSHDTAMTFHAAAAAAWRPHIEHVKMMDRSMAVTDAQAIGRGNRRGYPGLGVPNGGLQIVALRKTRRDG